MLAIVLGLLPCVAGLAFPYIPTTAFVNSTNATGIYIFEPNDDATSASLIALDSSRALTSNFAATTISPTLPFLSNDSNIAFTPFIDEAGNLYVLAGDCSKGATDTTLWTLKTGQDVQKASWQKADLSTNGFDNASTTGGINYLAGGFAFASTRNDTPTLYTFGGMCPNASTTSLTSKTWQYSANYSRALLAAAPSGILSSSSFASVSSNQDTFKLSQSPARGPPIAEAGFSVTALQPSYSGANQSTVQQNLVFIGGQTSQAFINMSQVALLSLPEQSWSFLPISNPSSASGELVRRDGDSVEPRSGHSAVLSEDGTKMVIYGGWVGDVDTPATPQLVILSVGNGYGGNGNWQWSVPTAGGSVPGGDGRYGHGAVMLPGNTMMVMGGNTIRSQGSKRKRAPEPASFFNLTSNSWISDYKNPLAPAADGSNPSGFDNSRGRTLGLGLGLGLGIPLFFIALCLLWCCLRRRHRKNKERQRILDRALMSRDGQRDLMSRDSGYDPGQMAMSERLNSQDPYPWAPGSVGRPSSEPEAGWRGMRSTEAERTGLLVEVPSPTRGLRRGVAARHTAYYDGARASRQSGIHVIDEQEEFEPLDGDLGTPRQDTETHAATLPLSTPTSRPASSYKLPEIRASPPIMDPFVDPLGAHPVTSSGTVSPVDPSPNEDQERDDRGWIEDWEVLNTRINPQTGEHTREQGTSGPPSPSRLSPDRISPESSTRRKGSPNHSDRTTSTLSEKSMHSAVSNVSELSRQSGTSLRHNPSQRSTNLFSVRQRSQGTSARRSLPATGTVAAAVATLQGTPPMQSQSGSRSRHARNDSDDLMTGSPGQKRLPSFGTLQAESHALLGRSAATPATHLSHGTNIEAGEYVDPEEDDEFPQRPNQRRSHGLIGSVKSALNIGRGRANSSSPTNQTTTTSPTTATFPGSSPSRSGTGTPFSLLRGMASEQETMAGRSQPSAEPTQYGGHTRTDSSGSNFWRLRQSGTKDGDWRQGITSGEADTRRSGSDESKKRQSTSSPETKTITESLRDDASGEWEISERQVQVMFTVPRERLRVVNAAEGDAESETLTRQSSNIDRGTGKQRAEGEVDIGTGQAQDDDENERLFSRLNPDRGHPGLW